MSAERWRLIPPETCSGPENMAIDEALLELVGQGESPPTLRFYEWQTPWISLGTTQPVGDLDQERVSARRWGVLRRSSGGTAVLHVGQLGYAVVLPSRHPIWEGDLASSYQRFADPLARAFARVGVQGAPAPPARKADFSIGAPPLASRVCFSALGPYEILDRRGRKLIGNSQIRRRTGSLQHGTIQLADSQMGLAEVLAGASAAQRRALIRYLADHVGSLAECADRLIDPTEVVDALARSFEEAFDVHLVAARLTDCERRLAAELVRNKYAEPGWTNRR